MMKSYGSDLESFFYIFLRFFDILFCISLSGLIHVFNVFDVSCESMEFALFCSIVIFSHAAMLFAGHPRQVQNLRKGLGGLRKALQRHLVSRRAKSDEKNLDPETC